ncbi:hypothetical protein [Mesorhizobium sp.]|uniref:hypothetical protein n=1 Tax=Mesorhizobium sp. TaxID=1871066 RepID=UPI000FE2B8C6|nr:hypothetical protein [Mesorhizobium sp.]RWA97127.1 MAG: hypothetical protein EOQ33_32705 [Mesorhizobium sp.]RWO03741.1 MAG: hypothetical protein EOS08_33785 [Mesorhizobium sp.]RWP14740.1 MAG: hypothetical protein EOR00_22855 [Mesorhizobium sp.]RWP26889.1 MAG: hypothetical protein EOR02_25005 [Mesorhizobium sp.]RWP58078.1 MAG: hypothetical protein EOR07_29925 [Mesorhizobium sp.]
MTNHLERSHSIVLSGPIDRVFPLFTPTGETLWVDGWDPEFLHPQDGETRQGMVFRTAHGDETTLWACTDWDPVALCPGDAGFAFRICRGGLPPDR